MAYGSLRVKESCLFFTGPTGVAWSLLSLVVIRVAFGFSEGSFSLSAVKMLSEAFPRKENGRAISILLMSSGLMTILVPVLCAVVIGGVGWRGMFFLIGAILIVLFWIFLRPRRAPAEFQASRPEAGETRVELHSLGDLLRSPMIWIIFVLSYGIYTVSWGLNT